MAQKQAQQPTYNTQFLEGKRNDMLYLLRNADATREALLNPERGLIAVRPNGKEQSVDSQTKKFLYYLFLHSDTMPPQGDKTLIQNFEAMLRKTSDAATLQEFFNLISKESSGGMFITASYAVKNASSGLKSICAGATADIANCKQTLSREFDFVYGFTLPGIVACENTLRKLNDSTVMGLARMQELTEDPWYYLGIPAAGRGVWNVFDKVERPHTQGAIYRKEVERLGGSIGFMHRAYAKMMESTRTGSWEDYSMASAVFVGSWVQTLARMDYAMSIQQDVQFGGVLGTLSAGLAPLAIYGLGRAAVGAGASLFGAFGEFGAQGLKNVLLTALAASTTFGKDVAKAGIKYFVAGFCLSEASFLAVERPITPEVKQEAAFMLAAFKDPELGRKISDLATQVGTDPKEAEAFLRKLSTEDYMRGFQDHLKFGLFFAAMGVLIHQISKGRVVNFQAKAMETPKFGETPEQAGTPGSLTMKELAYEGNNFVRFHRYWAARLADKYSALSDSKAAYAQALRDLKTVREKILESDRQLREIERNFKKLRKQGGATQENLQKIQEEVTTIKEQVDKTIGDFKLGDLKDIRKLRSMVTKKITGIRNRIDSIKGAKEVPEAVKEKSYEVERSLAEAQARVDVPAKYLEHLGNAKLDRRATLGDVQSGRYGEASRFAQERSIIRAYSAGLYSRSIGIQTFFADATQATLQGIKALLSQSKGMRYSDLGIKFDIASQDWRTEKYLDVFASRTNLRAEEEKIQRALLGVQPKNKEAAKSYAERAAMLKDSTIFLSLSEDGKTLFLNVTGLKGISAASQDEALLKAAELLKPLGRKFPYIDEVRFAGKFKDANWEKEFSGSIKTRISMQGLIDDVTKGLDEVAVAFKKIYVGEYVQIFVDPQTRALTIQLREPRARSLAYVLGYSGESEYLLASLIREFVPTRTVNFPILVKDSKGVVVTKQTTVIVKASPEAAETVPVPLQNQLQGELSIDSVTKSATELLNARKEGGSAFSYFESVSGQDRDAYITGAVLGALNSLRQKGNSVSEAELRNSLMGALKANFGTAIPEQTFNSFIDDVIRKQKQ